MKQDRWKLLLKALWGAVIALLVIFTLIFFLHDGPETLGTNVALCLWVVAQLSILTLLLIIVVRIKEWFEDQMAGRRDAVADGELQLLRQSMERIETRLEKIEKVLDGLPE